MSDPGEHTLACFSPFPIRNVKQAANPADQIGFICVKPPISINHLPQHLHHCKTILVVESVVDGPREAVKIGRLVMSGFGFIDQGVGFGIAKPKMRAQGCANGIALIAVEMPIHARRLDQKRCRGELRRLGFDWTGAARVGTAQEGLDTIDHGR